MWSAIMPKEGAYLPGFASISAASALKIASLNLCADEYLLMLARPHEIASVTRLSHDANESPLWRQARRHPANRGSLEEIIRARPTIILTMGGSGRSTALIARRLGIRSVDLPPPSGISDVATNIRTVAIALGDPKRANSALARIAALTASSPRTSKDAIFVSGGGASIGDWSAAKAWMRLAGLQQRSIRGGKVTLETLLVSPPEILLRSNYRSGQLSAGQAWFAHPIVKRLSARTRTTDGRAWTCAGPLMMREIERLRRVVR
jgi:iron complex transport system substrate-binding protein